MTKAARDENVENARARERALHRARRDRKRADELRRKTAPMLPPKPDPKALTPWPCVECGTIFVRRSTRCWDCADQRNNLATKRRRLADVEKKRNRDRRYREANREKRRAAERERNAKKRERHQIWLRRSEVRKRRWAERKARLRNDAATTAAEDAGREPNRN